MKEENILTSRFGKENHFQVPAGYFDQLADKVMAQLPEQTAAGEGTPSAEALMIDMSSHRSLWQHMPLRKIAAAVAAVMVLGAGSVAALHYVGNSHGSGMVAHADQVQHKVMAGSSEDATFNEMADYTMMDNETIYASLIAEN